MELNFDLIFRACALAFTAIAALKPLSDWLGASRGKLREEYAFAQGFFADLRAESVMHPFQRQKGFQAIAGDSTLSAAEIEYLLKMSDPAQSLKDYVLGRQYLAHFATAGRQQIVFASKFERRWSRLWRKGMYFVLYFFFAMGALSPIFFRPSPNDRGLLIMVFTMALFLGIALIFLRSSVKISRAELLVDNQVRT